MKSKFKIKGLDCANCATELERTIQKLDGVESANISFMTQKWNWNMMKQEKNYTKCKKN